MGSNNNQHQHEVIKKIQNSPKGQIHYETGWDKEPSAPWKLVSKIQDKLKEDKLLFYERLFRAVKKSEEREKLKKSGSGENEDDDDNVDIYYNNPSTSTSASSSVESSPHRSKVKRKTIISTQNKDIHSQNEEKVKPKVVLSPKCRYGIREEEEEYFPSDQSSEQEFNILPYQSNLKGILDSDSNKKGAGVGGKDSDESDRILREFIEEFNNFEIKQDKIFDDNLEEIRKRKEEMKAKREAERIEFATKTKKNIDQMYVKLELSDNEVKNQKKKEIQEKYEKNLKIKQENAKLIEEEKEKQKLMQEKQQELIRAKEKEKVVQAEAAQAAAIVAAQMIQKAKFEKEEEEMRKKEEEVVEKQKIGKSEQTTSSNFKVPPEIFNCILSEDLEKYFKSQKLIEAMAQEFSHINSQNPVTQNFYYAASKNVNTPLNSLSSFSQEHVQVKIQHFINLLDGKQVCATDTYFSSSSDPKGSSFIFNLMANRFVKKSEAELSKGGRGFLPLATLGATLCFKFPDWAILVQSYFYKFCPFLVPYSVPRNNLSIEDYAKCLGHDIKGKESAITQTLLERITGYCTLYAYMVKVFDRQKYPNFGNASEFFSISEVWRILIATIKLEPQLDVTVTILQALLDSFGSQLLITYKSQFNKFLMVLIGSYIPKIAKVCPPGQGAALARFNLFLEDKIPKGFL